MKILCAKAIILCLLTTSYVSAEGKKEGSETSGREELLFDFGWKFHFGDAASPLDDFGYGFETMFGKAGESPDVANTSFNDSTWRSVNLPHDWVVELDFLQVKEENVMQHGYKPVGRRFPKTTVGWYRRTFSVPQEDHGKRLTLRFEGVFRDCVVWLNGHFLGRNLSGYSEFNFDISDYINYGKRNVLVVRVDAGQYEGWFYEGAGIYRHVWLIKNNPLHIPLYGTFVKSDVMDKSANVTIETNVVNQSDISRNVILTSSIVNERGTIVGRTSSNERDIEPNGEISFNQSVNINNPELWSIDHPNLYKLISEIRVNGALTDRCELPFGIRTFTFRSDSGLFLNGNRVEIKGVCCHQDHAGVGSALPDRLQFYRIERLKEMGCNAYRTSHNPPTPALLDACDRLGMIVMDENRLMGSTSELMGEFRTQILRDRNHPSVFIWSLGNEEWQIHNNEVGTNIASSLKRLQRELDPSRLCTYAGNNGNHYEGINAVVDVRGINYIVLGDPDKYHSDHPSQPVMGSEEASTLCTRGIYAIDTTAGFMSDYDVSAPKWGTIAERWWKFYAARPWLAGAFVWTGFDYRGEPTPYEWPCISSHFGIMDVCGFPKNNFYYYQSWWTDKDVLHIAPHWNWTGKGKDTVNVWCQSNCDSVELKLNGKFVGRKRMEANSHLEFPVRYAPGTLEARGWKKGKRLTTKIETTGKASRLRLVADRSSIHADGEDVAVVTVSVLDDKGREIPDAENLVSFDINGEGSIIGVGNGNPSSHEPDKYLNGRYKRQLFSGKCQVIVQAGAKSGSIELSASSENISPARLSLKAESAGLRPHVE